MSKLEVRKLQLGSLRTNCYLIINQETKETLIVDPADQAERISVELKTKSLKPVAVLLTHGHVDHIGAAEKLRETYQISIYAGAKEEALLLEPRANLSAMFGKAMSIKADVPVNDGELLNLAGFEMQVFHTPGHTPGGVCYYIEKEQVLFSGDTLFCESVGRSDFPGGSQKTLIESIKRLFQLLPGETRVFPGHEGETDIAHEKRWNPYVYV